MDENDLLACLEYYLRQRGQRAVWGGRKDRKPDNPPPDDDPEIRWWCAHIGLDGEGKPHRGGPPIPTTATGFDIWNAYQVLESQGKIRTLKRQKGRAGTTTS